MADRTVRVRVEAIMSDFNRAMASGGASASAFANRLDAANGRMANLVQTGLALGPALVPISAAAVPALAGLTLQLGLGAAAAGTALLAFHGVGDGLKALNAYQLEPTAANFEKLQQAMDQLGPVGQEFVLELDKMTPKLHELQSLAEAGLLPGVADGLNQVLTLMPQAREVIFNISSTLGDLAREAGTDLTSPRWVAFFDYINTTANPVLTEMAHTFGNVTEGLASLLQDFDPLSRDFSTGLLDMSRSFRTWADSVGDTQGFQNFLSYVESAGPKTLAALGAIANTLLQLVEAAAPIGSVVLPIITALANGLSQLADSNVGPILISVAAAVGVLGRSMALLETVGLRGDGDKGFIAKTLDPGKIRAVVPAMREASAATTAFATAEAEASRAHRSYITSLQASSTFLGDYGKLPSKGSAEPEANALVAANQKQAAAAERVTEAERTKATAIREGAAVAAKGAAVAAGLALATSGIADDTGLANTASLALMGTLGGPWGAAVGGAVGFAKDLAAANNDVEASMQQLDRATSASTINFAAQQAAVASLSAASDDYQAKLAGIHSANPLKALPALVPNISDLFTHESEESTKALEKQLGALDELRTGVGTVYADLNHGSWKMFGADTQQITGYVNRLTPALEHAGVSARKFFAVDASADVRKKGEAAIRSYFQAMATGVGQSKAVGAALTELASHETDAATAASALKSSLDALFGVQLSQSAATDAWTQGLSKLRAQIAGTNGAILGNSKAALSNREAIRGSVQQLEDKVNADAAAGVSGGKLVDSLIKGRNAIIAQATAAGASRPAITAYLRQLGLTPKNLTTVIRTDGALSATQKIQALARVYKLTPRKLSTLIAEAGAKPTQAKIEALAKQYHLTPREVRTILSAVDNATRKAAQAQAAAQKFARLYSGALDAKDSASPKAAAARAKALAFAKQYAAFLEAHDQSSSVVRTAISVLQSFNGRHADAYITTHHVTVFSNKGKVGHQAGNPTIDTGGSQDGSYYVGRTRRFDAGGYTGMGQRVPRVSQFAKGGSNILWAEPETGQGEFYISLKPSMRERNLQLLGMAGDRLGADVTRRADGGTAGSIDRATIVRALRISASSAYLNPGQARQTAAQLAAGKSLASVAGRLQTYSRQLTHLLATEKGDIDKEPMFQQIRRFRDEFAAVVKLTRRPPSATVILHRATTAVTAAQRELNHADANRKKRENETKKAYQAHLKAVRGVASELTKVDDKLKAQRDARKEYAGTVSSAYVSDPFGGSLAGFNAQLGYESRNIRGAKTDLATAKAHGLSGALYQGLAASGNTGLIDQFAHLSRAQIAREERLYSTRNRLDKQLGTQAANAVFNTRIAHLTTQVQGLTAELHKVRTGKSLGKTEVHLHGSKARDTEQLAKRTAKQLEQALLVAKHG